MNFHNVEFFKSYGMKKQLEESEQMEIVFAGRSNVGKSSLINKIFNRKGLARVSSMPGKTATINLFRLDHVDFVDLPGYGYAKVSKGEKKKWSELIEGYFHNDRNIVLVLQLIDMRHPPSKADINMVNFLIEMELPFIVVLTKADKLNRAEYAERMSKIRDEVPAGEDVTFVPISSTKGTGFDELKEIILDVTYVDETIEQDETDEDEETEENSEIEDDEQNSETEENEEADSADVVDEEINIDDVDLEETKLEV